MRALLRVVGVALLAASSLAGCSGGSGRVCLPAADLVPSCGVLLGIVTNPNTNVQLDRVERGIGATFGMVYRFHDLDDRFPTADEKALVKAGRVLHVSIDSRIYQPPGRQVPWAEVAAGRYDSVLTADARGVAALRAPVFITFDHEPDQPDRAAAGSPADFIAAWRHVREVFLRAGASNAVWVWVVTGYPASFSAAGRLWPGNAYVDWISWEAYNGSGCMSGPVQVGQFRTFAQTVLPFYDWLEHNGARLNIDTRKPMMISEAGSVVYPDDPQLTAEWYRAIPDVLHDNPRIRAIGLWDHPGTGNCPYQFDQLPQVRKAVRSVAQSATIRGQ